MKDYNEIDDFTDMVALMEALHISTKGLNGLDEMKSRVRDELKRVDKAPRSTGEEALIFQSILLEAKRKEETKRVLLDFYGTVDEFLNGMPLNEFSLLQNHVDIKEKMKAQMDQLRQEKYCLLVTGETSSGKSSLVNLLLGEEILPSFYSGRTCTICEIKYGENPKIVAHFKDKDPETGEPTKTVLLEEPTGSSKKCYLEQTFPYVHEQGSSFKKIELFLPHSFLKNGIMIVDSPGIGEEMDDIVIQYLPKAFAFIYVLDSPRSGGILGDSLEYFFKKSFQASVGEQGEASLEALKLLQSKCALFVCNKWDQVKGSEDVKKVVKEKLKRSWPGFDPESQIIYLSTKEALLAQEYGIITDEFLSLMNGMGSVVLNAIGTTLEIQWRWLDYVLKMVILQSNDLIRHVVSSRDKVKQKMEQVLLRLDTIKDDQDQVIQNLRRDFEDRINEVVEPLTEYLLTDAVKSRFIAWRPHQVPPEKRSWKETEDQIRELMSIRLIEIVDKWEDENMLFKSAHESILQHIQRSFNSVAVQRYEAQRDTLATLANVPEILNFDLPSLRAIVGWLLLRSRSWVLRKIMGESPDMLRYKQDRCLVMAEKSAAYLDDVTQGNELRRLVKDKLRGLNVFLDQIEARVPELMREDELLYQELRTEKSSGDALCEAYQRRKDEMSTLRGKLAEFGIRNVCAVDITSKELQWKEDVPSCLHSGRFWAVYLGQMRRNEDVKTIALKVYKEEITASNASAIMNEVEWLRILKHPNIVKFYGTSLVGEADNVRVILVMEKCKGDLKSHIFKNPSSVPGRTEEPAVVMRACQWVKEITDALAFIHENGIIHRNLKLETILMSEENSVRIGGVGLAKREENIAGTLAGTPVYLAPEVFRGEQYDFKADIYSLGIILWEMWYGQQAFLCDAPTSLEEFFSWVQEGNRPVHRKDCKKPPPIWQDMMTSCWDGDPEKRPTAKKCNEDIATLCAD